MAVYQQRWTQGPQEANSTKLVRLPNLSPQRLNISIVREPMQFLGKAGSTLFFFFPLWKAIKSRGRKSDTAEGQEEQHIRMD